MKGCGLYYLVRGEGEGRGGAEIGVGEGGELERTGEMSSLSLFIILFCEILYLLADYTRYCCALSLFRTSCVIWSLCCTFCILYYVGLYGWLLCAIAAVVASFIALVLAILLPAPGCCC